jgi:lipopolysaccharide/colanic/teichoic acid biosynthesis glycosyltransferase
MYSVIKRIFDVLFSLLAIIVLSPVLVPVIIGLKLTGEGHIWYFQERVGYRQKLFNIWKFATMLKNSPNMAGGLITLKRDPRLTPMGGFLRTSKINELPQLFNILRGEMSFVGPRPVMRRSLEAYPSDVQVQIYNVPPGLTGIASLVFRDEETLITNVKNNGGDVWKFYTRDIYPYKGLLEQWYQRNQSFSTDFLILFLTAWLIIRPQSDLVFRVFSGLPKRPETLRL